MILNSTIRFPNMGIELKDLSSGINIFGIDIAYYGVIIAVGMLVGYLIAEKIAKETGQNPEIYLDFALYAVIISVICARLYYVIFQFDEFRGDPIQILNLRSGGLAIYGGIIGAILTGIIFSKIKKYPFWLLADTGAVGLVAGQAIGRWGNFFNREAFGKYSDGLFAMQLSIADVSYEFRAPMTYLEDQFRGKTRALDRIVEIREKMISIDGMSYIQVHPTFLYESVWNIGLLIFLILYTKRKKFDGEVMLMYMAGYGLGRFWIEGLRTDQLFLWGTPIAISQLLALVIFVVSAAAIIHKRNKLKKTS